MPDFFKINVKRPVRDLLAVLGPLLVDAFRVARVISKFCLLTVPHIAWLHPLSSLENIGKKNWLISSLETLALDRLIELMDLFVRDGSLCRKHSTHCFVGRLSINLDWTPFLSRYPFTKWRRSSALKGKP